MNRVNSAEFRVHDSMRDRADDEIDLARLVSLIRRNWQILALGGLIGLLLGIAHVATTTRLYTAHVEINTFRSADLETFQDFTGITNARNSSFDFDTEIEVLRSDKIAERAVLNLGLHEQPIFAAAERVGPINRIRRFVTEHVLQRGGAVGALPSGAAETLLQPETPNIDEQLAIERAVRQLREGIIVIPVRRSAVLRVSYTSPSRLLSARIANGIAEAYIEDQFAATDEASQRAITWLLTRRDELRAQLERVTLIADQFREDHDLLGVNTGQIADAELERLSQNLVAARAEQVELEARARRLAEIVMNADSTAVVRETATQGITSGLRSRYLDVLSSYNTLAVSLGEEHAQTQRRLRELREIEALMFEEIRRSAELVHDDLRAMRERVASLEAAQARVGERVGADQATLLQLRDMERDIETLRDLYTSFQQRHQEATQRQQIPVSNARILNRAQPPEGPSAPNAKLILALGGFLGFLSAGGLVAFREWSDNSIRSEEDIRDHLGFEYLGGLPLLKGLSGSPRGLPPAEGMQEKIVHLPESLTFASDHPLSNYAETLRAGKISFMLRHGQTVLPPKIGFVSCFPVEGKTTTATNFASLLAQQGARVMLIDADIRNPGLSWATGQSFEAGLGDVLLGTCDWRDARQRVQGTSLHLLANSKTPVVNTSELLGSAMMADLLAQLEQDYDYIILDLPPLGPVIDARVVLDKLDGLFFIVKWGETNRGLAQRILRMDSRIHEKCYGAFLNFFDPQKAQAYGAYQAHQYDSSYYQRYFLDR